MEEEYRPPQFWQQQSQNTQMEQNKNEPEELRPIYVIHDFDIKKCKAVTEMMASIQTNDKILALKIPTEHGHIILCVELDKAVSLTQAIAHVFKNDELEYHGIRTPDIVKVPVFQTSRE